MKHRTLTPYYNTVINTTLEFCKYLNRTDENALTKWMFASILKTAEKRIVHPCPYFGPIRVFNITLENVMSAQFLKGQYKMSFKIVWIHHHEIADGEAPHEELQIMLTHNFKLLRPM
ncbi:CLUMA_CG007906, isoform A [Clunio marinus]|uniref:CLUMA_CG007906, isoform A n=1 Tax=Clunio marinus TaxID=568069 RepID=A0A1J1I232_9DIPT|nr:CLUMA_CG007906, isoform A [Clunio marinus]